ncbi:MAG TPA: DoxX family protein [Acidimicrobiales bacterium]|nr:DoxX family protein [Acidimicrobiales bacterium]
MLTGLLLLRLLIGLTLAAHGSQKVFGAFGGGGLEGTGAWLESIGFRPARRQALMAGGTELLGGLALACGLMTPFAAAGIIGVMAVAGVAGHGGKGFFITRGGWEYCVVLAGAAAVLAFTGPGDFSIDHLIGFDGGGNLWGLFAVALGVAGAAGQMATRRTQVDLRDSGAIAGPRVATRQAVDG